MGGAQIDTRVVGIGQLFFYPHLQWGKVTSLDEVKLEYHTVGDIYWQPLLSYGK